MVTKLRSNTINALGSKERKNRKKKTFFCLKTLSKLRSCDVDYFIIAASTRCEYQTKALNPVVFNLHNNC